MKYRWVIFDADHTLYDYDRAESLALRGSFEAFELPWQDSFLPAYREINIRYFRLLEQKLITAPQLRVQRFVDYFEVIGIECDVQEFANYYLSRLAAGSMLLPSSKEVVLRLHQRYNLLLLTNGLSLVQRPRIKQSEIAHCFEALIISDEVGAAKPNRKIFDIAFERMGYPHMSEVLMVGDNLIADIKGGTDYGIDTCWFNPDRLVPEQQEYTYEIHVIEQLLPIMGHE